jgi:DNA-binding protein WhiA
MLKKSGQSFVRANKLLIPAIEQLFKENFFKNLKVRRKGCRLFIENTDAVELRRKYVERFSRIAPGAKNPKHCQTAFFQGLFLVYGYMQNPGRGYHFEIRLRNKWLIAALKKTARFLKIRLNSTTKTPYRIFYSKSSKRIVQILSRIGLFDRSLELSDFLATRKILSMVNRQVNSETANINRLIQAAEKKILCIEELFSFSEQEFWTESLRQMALARLKYPHDSIEKLGTRFSPPLSKSAVNHRLRRISALHKKLFPGKKDEND